MAPRISVVTVTNRPGSIDVTWGGLRRQTLRDFEWILCDELFDWRSLEVDEYVSDDRLHHIPAPTRKEDLWNLNKSYNEALRHCRGEFVVSLQDYIWIPPEALARYWEVHEDIGPRGFLTGISHTCALPVPVHDLRGRVTIFRTPYTEKPTRQIKTDDRFDGELWYLPRLAIGDPIVLPDPDVSSRAVQETMPAFWEINWAGAPRRAFYEIGGFPEDHDGQFYSCDNLTIAFCAQRLGYRFYFDKANGCYPIDHGGIFPRVPDWEERHGRFGPWDRWYEDWRRKGCPRFSYLTDDALEPANQGDAPPRSD